MAIGTERVKHALVLTAGLPAHWARMLPGFLIAGAQRSGTTSMSRMLGQHPAVAHTALNQEVHYFDTRYGRGLGWYRSHFPLAACARRAAAGLGVAPVAFDSSPYYMFHPLAPERIRRDLPGVKLLVLLRDPVERSYSAHAHESALGFETESYERALDLEEARLRGEADRIVADPAYNSFSYQHHSYRARGRYAEQLEHLTAPFGRDQLHVVDSGDFFADPGPAFEEVLDFLDLPGVPCPDVGPRNARPHPAARPASIRAGLEDYYQPHDERLARWLGHPPSWRR